MKHLTASVLAVAMTLTAGTASAQQYHLQPAGPSSSQGGYYDYARVIRVDPVHDYRTNDRYAASTGGARCVENRTYAGSGYRDRYDDGYRGGYRDGSGYRDGYRDRYDDRYRDGYGYGDRYDGRYRDGYGYGGGAQAGSTAATVIGGIVGAVIGSQIGGGSGKYATTAIGSMVGGIAGQRVYEEARRNREAYSRVGTVIACDPMPVSAYENHRASLYDVTYEYNGQRQTTRMSYDPGDRVRVRVDVRAE